MKKTTAVIAAILLSACGLDQKWSVVWQDKNGVIRRVDGMSLKTATDWRTSLQHYGYATGSACWDCHWIEKTP